MFCPKRANACPKMKVVKATQLARGTGTVITRLYGLIVAATVTVGLLALPMISSGQDPERQEKLDELLRQRQATLRQIVEVLREQYLLGERDFNAVVEAQDRLMKAELELASDRQERLALLRERVKMFETLSTLTNQRFDLGQVGQPETLFVRAAVLEAKIELAREQERERAGEPAN